MSKDHSNSSSPTSTALNSVLTCKSSSLTSLTLQNKFNRKQTKRTDHKLRNDHLKNAPQQRICFVSPKRLIPAGGSTLKLTEEHDMSAKDSENSYNQFEARQNDIEKIEIGCSPKPNRLMTSRYFGRRQIAEAETSTSLRANIQDQEFDRIKAENEQLRTANEEIPKLKKAIQTRNAILKQLEELEIERSFKIIQKQTENNRFKSQIQHLQKELREQSDIITAKSKQVAHLNSMLTTLKEQNFLLRECAIQKFEKSEQQQMQMINLATKLQQITRSYDQLAKNVCKKKTLDNGSHKQNNSKPHKQLKIQTYSRDETQTKSKSSPKAKGQRSSSRHKSFTFLRQAQRSPRKQPKNELQIVEQVIQEETDELQLASYSNIEPQTPCCRAFYSEPLINEDFQCPCLHTLNAKLHQYKQQLKYKAIEINMLKRFKFEAQQARECADKFKKQNRKLLMKVQQLARINANTERNKQRYFELELTPEKYDRR